MTASMARQAYMTIIAVVDIVTENCICGIRAASPAISSKYVSTHFAGQANQPATAGTNMPASPATKLNNMANGISGTTNILASSATKLESLKIYKMSGNVMSWAAVDSSKTSPKTPFNLFLKNFWRANGAKTSTPKNAKNDRYQPMSDQMYSGFHSAVLAA